jgi:DNA-binding transcriptional LysR family regulator
MTVKLTELSAFLAVAEHLSFQRAALDRGVTRSALSHAVRGLEEAVGVRLLSRNTRSVSLTEAGALLQARLKPAFGDIDQAVDEVNRFRDTPYGTIRVTVPRAVGSVLMGPVIARLVRENPGLSLEVSSSDALIDIVAEGFDAGIRFGERLQQDMIASRIGLDLRFAVVGSPEYFAGRTPPNAPHDLMAHECIRYRFPSGAAFDWEFEKDAQEVQVAVHGPVLLDDQDLMIETALAGAGLAFVFADRVSGHLESGRLVRCLEDWSPQFSSLFLYYPNRKFVPAGLRALIELLKRPKRI